MKKYISLILLVVFLLPSLGFVGIKNSIPQQEVSGHKSVVWGFDCKTWYDKNTNTFAKTFNTYNTAKKISSLLGQHGFETELRNNPADRDTIFPSFENAEVFFYIGHGLPDGLVFIDEKCNGIFKFTKDTLSSIDSSSLKFVLLSACETGKDINDTNSMLRAFKEAGAKKTIGFNRLMSDLAIQSWSKKFWGYALQDKMEVSDAARLATIEMERMEFQRAVIPGWVTADSLVILGSEPVYLGYEKKTPDLRQGIDQFLQDLWNNIQEKIQQVGNQMLEKFNAWWADQWHKIQISIEKWVQEQLSRWLETLSKELEKILTQICFQPVSIALLFSGISILQKRRNQ